MTLSWHHNACSSLWGARDWRERFTCWTRVSYLWLKTKKERRREGKNSIGPRMKYGHASHNSVTLQGGWLIKKHTYTTRLIRWLREKLVLVVERCLRRCIANSSNNHDAIGPRFGSPSGHVTMMLWIVNKMIKFSWVLILPYQSIEYLNASESLNRFDFWIHYV